jgi:hypothetical protein
LLVRRRRRPFVVFFRFRRPNNLKIGFDHIARERA